MIDSTANNPSNNPVSTPAPHFIVAGRMLVNLAQVNAIELGATSRVAADTNLEAAIVYFASGDKRWFFGDEAAALREALQMPAVTPAVMSESRTRAEVQP